MMKALMVAAALAVAGMAGASAQAPQGGKLAHTVFFTLKDKSPAAAERMVGECRKYLQGHPGEVYFAAGTRAKELQREVNDKDFDVFLQVVFATKADQDRYQSAERHKEFIKVNEAGWEKVRVFDSNLPK